MKRLLLVACLFISSVTIFAIADQQVRPGKCDKKKICGTEKRSTPASDAKIDYIFWQPVNRLMLIQN